MIFHYMLPYCFCNYLGQRSDVHFIIDVFHMAANGFIAYMQLVTDHLIAKTLYEISQYFLFSLCKIIVLSGFIWHTDPLYDGKYPSGNRRAHWRASGMQFPNR